MEQEIMEQGQEQKEEGDIAGDETNGVPAPQHPYAIPLSIIIAGALIAGAVAYTNTGRNQPIRPDTASAGTAAGGVVADPKIIAANAPFLGDPQAPVTVVEFGDFQCPFCAAVEGVQNAVASSLKGRNPSWTAPIPLIIKNYATAGKVKFVYRDFAFLGAESEWASEAAACAGEQGKFWQYHDYLYHHQNGENEGAFAKDNLKHFALELGLDGSKFNTCLDSNKFLAAVRKSKSDGQGLGVNGTPASFINGHLLQGAVSYDEFAAAIDAELQKIK